MLKLADKNDLGGIISFCQGDLTGTRIGCYCQCYGFERDFFSLWINETDGEIKGLIAKFYDSITVKVAADCEADEITQFLGMLPYNEIMCSESTAELLGLADCTLKKSYLFRGKAGEYPSENLGEGYYKQLYRLVSDNIPASFKKSDEAYLSWLSDFTFRKRRNLARSRGVTKNGELLSSVITSSETKDSAILSAVATSDSSRGTGIGKSTVLSAVYELQKEEKAVYVIALNKSAEGFYEHIGFKFNEMICFKEGKE